VSSLLTSRDTRAMVDVTSVVSPGSSGQAARMTDRRRWSLVPTGFAAQPPALSPGVRFGRTRRRFDPCGALVLAGS
jgi:hypothetical protein